MDQHGNKKTTASRVESSNWLAFLSFSQELKYPVMASLIATGIQVTIGLVDSTIMYGALAVMWIVIDLQLWTK